MYVKRYDCPFDLKAVDAVEAILGTDSMLR